MNIATTHRKLKPVIRGVLVIVFLFALRSAPGLFGTTDYSFAVPEMVMDVQLQPDASARISYTITFKNYGQAIDVVDIGLPHKGYDIRTMRASIDESSLTDIRQSTYIDTGVEIRLGQRAIPRGSSGTLRFEATMPNMVYQDTSADDLAAFQITPTWFDARMVRGTGDILVNVTFPAGLDPERVFSHDRAFGKRTENGQITLVNWRFKDVPITQPHLVGVSFPKAVMQQVTVRTFWGQLDGVLKGLSDVVVGVILLPVASEVGLAGVLMLGILYWWGKRRVPGLKLPRKVEFAALAWLLLILVLSAFGAWGVGFWIIGVLNEVFSTKPKYLPPIAEVEGGGIKRGLTAPEAAVVLELPLNKVLMLVVFGMLEKGLVYVQSPQPLKLAMDKDFLTTHDVQLKHNRMKRCDHRREVARQRGTILHAYEDPFLDLLEEHPDKPLEELNVVPSMQALVDQVAAKMQGFELDATREYYQRIIAQAVQDAAGLEDVEVYQEHMDQQLPWALMHRNYRSAMRAGQHAYWPRWARGVGRTSIATGGAAFRDAAGSFADWTERTMGKMSDAIMPTTLRKPSTSSARSGRSRGGHGGSCACAGGGR